MIIKYEVGDIIYAKPNKLGRYYFCEKDDKNNIKLQIVSFVSAYEKDFSLGYKDLPYRLNFYAVAESLTVPTFRKRVAVGQEQIAEDEEIL